MSSAAGSVLNTVELLERILLDVPPKELLLSQRVNSFWNAVVVNSTKLQQALFRKPITKSETWTALIVAESMSTNYGPHVIEAVNPADRVPCKTRKITVAARVNPLLLPKETPLDQDDDDIIAFTTIADYCYLERSYSFSKLLSQSLDSRTPSWLDMYLTQPPAKQISLHVAPDKAYEGKVGTLRLHEPNGVTMRTVVKETLRAYPSVPGIDYLEIEFWDAFIADGPKRGWIEEGIARFRRLESKIGRANALEIEVGGLQHPQDMYLLMEDDNLDKVVEMGKVDDMMGGESIFDILDEYEDWKGAQDEASDLLKDDEESGEVQTAESNEACDDDRVPEE